MNYPQIIERIYDAAALPNGFADILPDLCRFLGSPSPEAAEGTVAASLSAESASPAACHAPDRRDEHLQYWAQSVPQCCCVNGFGASEVERIAALRPHLERASRLRGLVLESTRDRDNLRRGLDALSTAIALLDATGKILWRNRAAGERFADPPRLWIDRGRLQIGVKADAAAVELSLSEALLMADAEHGPRRRAAPLAPALVQREGGAPLVLHFLPLAPPESLRQGDTAAARVLLLVRDPVRDARLDPSVVARFYGLTQTEALLAVAIAQGQSVAEFAAARHTSEQTARTHLKHIFEKTQTDRQAALVRLLLLGPGPHALG